MSSKGEQAMRCVALMALCCGFGVAVPTTPASAQEYQASTPPAGRFFLRVFPEVFFTNAYFNEDGKAVNLDSVTGLLHAELPLNLQYGVTGALAVGAILPVTFTYQEVEPRIRSDAIHRFWLPEGWLTLQYRFWTLPFIASAGLKVKIPLMDKEDWEDGLRIGDGQVDLAPVLHVDYQSPTRYWFVRLTAGYKYRFKSGSEKPFDEWNLRTLLGFELWDRPKIDLFGFADLTAFRNGDYGSEDLRFFEQEGSLHTLGYGMSMEPYPMGQIYIETAGDFSGRNRYRAMRWRVGLRHPFGSGR
jgi:hypothetical protein